MYSYFSPLALASSGMSTWSGRFSFLAVVFVAALQASYVYPFASATQLHYVHWNTSNPIFRIDNTDHIIDVNKGNVQFEYDQVNIICPVYSENSREKDAEKYIIYNVSKEEYDTCRITNPAPRIIAVCDKPYKLMYFTITFRSFTPQPGGLEFRPGQDYYFISTSSVVDLYQRIGGRCTSHHMKVVFKVCCDPSSQPAKDQANGHHLPSIIGQSISTPRGSSSTVSTTAKTSSVSTTPKSSRTSSTTITTTTTLQSTTPRKTPSRKSYGARTNLNGRNKAGKKRQSHNKSEAVKNELTTYSSAESTLYTRWRTPCHLHRFSLFLSAIFALASRVIFL